MNAISELYRQERFLLMTLDPMHVGTGGQRLGRVDLSIVREPGTRLPKIPGTSLSGAIRTYAAYRYESRRCAGAGQGEGDKSHCRDPKCPVCYTFGYLRGQDGGQSGTVSIGDARLLLFPVYSAAGPVWITCPEVLREFGVTEPDCGEKVRLPSTLGSHSHLNLGWLMLEAAPDPFQWPDTVQGVPNEIRDRAVLISDKLFGQVVNSNLEVRTSVSIDPETGAAAERKLFTYEAIPRAALLWLDVVQDDFRKAFPQDNEKAQALGHTGPLDVVKAGLALAEYLGIGGMGTRGFGRLRRLATEDRV
ncbi:MAG: RAMP superfamily CRISPR-associated protein [Chloroflexi bacterium]|nr:RAMP superfamily CRISPR-associated protein [Chloroflexota bacterium]